MLKKVTCYTAAAVVLSCLLAALVLLSSSAEAGAELSAKEVKTILDRMIPEGQQVELLYLMPAPVQSQPVGSGAVSYAQVTAEFPCHSTAELRTVTKKVFTDKMAGAIFARYFNDIPAFKDAEGRLLALVVKDGMGDVEGLVWDTAKLTIVKQSADHITVSCPYNGAYSEDTMTGWLDLGKEDGEWKLDASVFDPGSDPKERRTAEPDAPIYTDLTGDYQTLTNNLYGTGNDFYPNALVGVYALGYAQDMSRVTGGKDLGRLRDFINVNLTAEPYVYEGMTTYFLIVPKYKDSKISVHQLVEGKPLLLETDKTVVLACCDSEGNPTCEVIVRHNDTNAVFMPFIEHDSIGGLIVGGMDERDDVADITPRG